HPSSLISHLALVVVSARDARRTPRRRAVEAGERALPEPRLGNPALGGALRQPRVRSLRRRPRPSRPPPFDAPRGWRALAARSRDGVLRLARPLLVSLHARPQRAAIGRRLATARGCRVRGVRRTGRLGVGS